MQWQHPDCTMHSGTTYNIQWCSRCYTGYIVHSCKCPVHVLPSAALTRAMDLLWACHARSVETQVTTNKWCRMVYVASLFEIYYAISRWRHPTAWGPYHSTMACHSMAMVLTSAYFSSWSSCSSIFSVEATASYRTEYVSLSFTKILYRCDNQHLSFAGCSCLLLLFPFSS